MTPTTLAADAAQALQGVTDLIGKLGRAAFYLLDNCEESGPVGRSTFTVKMADIDRLSDVLDQIEALPFTEPGFILGPGAMLQTALTKTLTALSEQNSLLAAQVAELTREKQAIALDALAASGQAQEAYEAQLAAEAKVARLEGALVDHNDLLRSAFAIAKREGVEGEVASTNWDAYYNRVAVVLKRHHETANEARAALTEGTQDE